MAPAADLIGRSTEIAASVLSFWIPSSLRATRDRLPWRRDPYDPWAVLVSEVMLAQTGVGRVAKRFGPFLAQYPAPEAMAADRLGEVLRAWTGLGYPRRAARLREAAVVIAGEHAGVVPADLESLSRLAGVGPYTARAVLAFAYDRPEMPVDTNVGRVLARALAGRPLTKTQAQSAADGLAHAGGQGGGRLLAQAVMDLGAQLCTPRRPRCGACPLGDGSAICAWQAARQRAAAPSSAGAPAPLGATFDDPARRSAAASRRQARFEGSDRQGRGRMLRSAAAGPIAAARLAEVAGWPDDPARAERVAASLLFDGLLVRTGTSDYELP